MIDRIMHLCQLEIITIIFHAFYIMKNGTLLCDVTMTLTRQEKIGNILFLKQHICFLKKMNINHFYPKMHTVAQISTKRPALIYIAAASKQITPEFFFFFFFIFMPRFTLFLAQGVRCYDTVDSRHKIQ